MSNRDNSGQIEVREPQTLWNIQFIMVIALGFITGSANHMLYPILSGYALSLGASLALAGTIVGLMNGVAMFIRPLSGFASDLFNRKYVMVGSCLVSAAAYVGYLVFASVTAIIICRIMQGIAFSFMSVARTAYATEYMPKDKIGEGIAFTTFGIILSQAVGPVMGLWISDRWGHQTSFILALTLTLTGAALTATLKHTHTKKPLNRNTIKFNNLIAVEVVPYALIAGLFVMINPIAHAFIALVGAERNIANVGLLFTVYSVCTLIMRPISGRLLDKMDLPVLLYPAFVFAGITMVLLGSAHGIALVLLAGMTSALSQGIAVPAIQGSCIKRIGRERAGVVAATIYMGQDLLSTAAPPLGGFFVTNVGYRDMFYIFAAIMLIGMLAYMFLRRNEKKRSPRDSKVV